MADEKKPTTESKVAQGPVTNRPQWDQEPKAPGAGAFAHDMPGHAQRNPGDPEPTTQNLADEERRKRGGIAEMQALEQQWRMPTDQYITVRAQDTNLDPDAKSEDGFVTNREQWETERRSQIDAAVKRNEAVPNEVLIDHIPFDGKVQVLTISGVPVSVVKASVGAQIKRQESRRPTQADLYEWKATINGNVIESSAALTREELVPAINAFLRKSGAAGSGQFGTRDAAKTGHWSTQKTAPRDAQAPAVKKPEPVIETGNRPHS